MRYQPMTVREACTLECDMLEHFELMPSEWKSATKYVPASVLRTTRQLPKRAAKALDISQAFIELVNDPTDAPLCMEEMILAVRYKMGYGWWAWFVFSKFAVPIIRWLWRRYHSSTPENSSQGYN